MAFRAENDRAKSFPAKNVKASVGYVVFYPSAISNFKPEPFQRRQAKLLQQGGRHHRVTCPGVHQGGYRQEIAPQRMADPYIYVKCTHMLTPIIGGGMLRAL